MQIAVKLVATIRGQTSAENICTVNETTRWGKFLRAPYNQNSIGLFTKKRVMPISENSGMVGATSAVITAPLGDDSSTWGNIARTATAMPVALNK